MTRSHAATVASPAVVTLLRVLAALSVLVIVIQGVTAGEILSRSATAAMLHSGGAVVVHVLTGLTAIAAFLVVRATGGPWWPPILAACLFVVTFLQAYLGSHGVMAVHVPLAMICLVGAVWVLVWSLAAGRTRA
ncbi:hypothetical protein LWC35_28925 [Pseudonocardia kujensis]|uniref:hypothetical protein n=1 Tax=Pseudonocardia kujensis TaxID=1128675 RepID=UPI001E645B53|nr:hypothetical protein [Pseudonocardia kujensis]MCE0766900.1 hypothetical protein [Pseudonocardia kujensis]